MSGVRFLTLEQIIHLHKRAIEDYGGSLGVRDKDLLDSAITQPQASFGGVYLHESISLMAAAYYFHISQNQPFIDGNKRTGMLSMYAFLEINGYELNVENATLYPILLDVAEGRLSKEGLAIFIEQYTNGNK